jgi:4-hydroxybenzoate polyprenyltransferase
MLLGGSIFGMAAHFINVIKDMEEDQVSGIQGLPQRLGTKRSVIVAITLITFGVFAIYFTA